MRGYVLWPKLQILIYSFGDDQEVVTKVGRFYRRSSRTCIGVTHRYPVSPIVSNVLVDVVVRALLPEVCGSQKAHHGFVWVA